MARPVVVLPVRYGSLTRLNTGLAYRLCRNLYVGMTRKGAVELEGVSHASLKAWLQRANDIMRALYHDGHADGPVREPDPLPPIEQLAYEDFLAGMQLFVEEDQRAASEKRSPRHHTIPVLPATRDGHFLALLSSVHQAEAALQARLLRKIHDADSWQASAWLLERKFPRTYGRDTALLLGDEGMPDADKQVIILPAKADSGETWAEIVEREREKESA